MWQTVSYPNCPTSSLSFHDLQEANRISYDTNTSGIRKYIALLRPLANEAKGTHVKTNLSSNKLDAQKDTILGIGTAVFLCLLRCFYWELGTYTYYIFYYSWRIHHGQYSYQLYFIQMASGWFKEINYRCGNIRKTKCILRPGLELRADLALGLGAP